MARPRKQERRDGAPEAPPHLREVAAPLAPPEVLPTIGPLQELRRARQARGVDLEAAASALRIRPEVLRALEEGRIDDLPGPAYTVGFLRSYAAYLGLNPADLVQRFRTQARDFPARQELNFPAPTREGFGPTKAMIAAAAALALLIYGGWYAWSEAARGRGEAVAPVPSRLAEPAPAVVAATPAPEAPVSVSPPSPATAAAPGSPVAAVSAPAAPAPEAAPVESASSPALAAIQRLEAAGPRADGRVPQVFGRQNRDARIVLRARQDSWVQVVAPGGEALLTRVLRAGDIYLVPNRRGLLLQTGNAGALEVEVDGRALPPVGPLGEVRRNVALDALAERSGAAR